jgi:mannosyltransferase OCH1-like enzyme
LCKENGSHGPLCEKRGKIIPKQIFMCDKTLTHITIYSENWKKLNPEYDIKLYDDSMCEEFLTSEFSEKHCDIFKFIKSGPIKADFWRVCVIYKYGGLYVDADIEPIAPLKDFIDSSAQFVTCSSYGPNFNPNFIMARAGDDLLKKVIDLYLKMYSENIDYSYWDWSIMTLFNKTLILENYNKADGIYYDKNSKKYQILKEIKAENFEDDHNIYNSIKVFNNRYKAYDCYTHSFRT